jgi:hypothetical protein
MRKPEDIADIRKRLAPLGFAVIHIDALRTAQVYLERREPECDSLSDHGIGLGEYGSALNTVAQAIEAHDREIFRSITTRKRRAPNT